MPKINLQPEVLSLAATNNRQAVNQIIETYQQPLYNHILRLVGDIHLAEDLTQDTFIKLYKNLSKLNQEKNFNAWLYKIATNTVYDFWRAKKRRPESFLSENEDNQDNETLNPAEAYYLIEQNQQQKIDLELALSQLKPLTAAALRLYYQQGFSCQEIAEILNQPPGTVKTNLARGKITLQKILNQ